jgi:hypothetical protein
MPHSYYSLTWFFLIGAFLPIPFYYLARRSPRSIWRYINIPVALVAADSVPPANGVNFSSWILTGFFFQWFMRRYHYRWWIRYNYLLSTGLDAGIIIGVVVIFFALQLPRGGIEVNWWGNSVWKNTVDANLTPLKTVAPGELSHFTNTVYLYSTSLTQTNETPALQRFDNTSHKCVCGKAQ